MADNDDKVKIVIDGRSLVVSGGDTPEHVYRVADYVNQKISECSKSPGYSKMSQDTRITLLELNIGDDYINSEEKLEKTLLDLADKDKELFELKHELIDVKAKLETALGQVSELQSKAAENAAKIMKLETDLKSKNRK